MAQRQFRFFICTRDRPHMLERCIASLAAAFNTSFPNIFAQCYIFDDSTNIDISHFIYTKWNTQQILGLNVIVINSRKQEEVFQQLSDIASHHQRKLRVYCKTLGQGGWDLAGVRNFAFLYAYAYAHEEDLLVFIDDDILFQSDIYQTHPISIDGSKVLRAFEAYTPPKAVRASGVSYFGRADIPVYEHIQQTMEDLRLSVEQREPDLQQLDALHLLFQGITLFPHTLPTRLNLPGTISVENGPGISGAALATTPASIRSHGLIRAYNEDWIWLTLLGTAGSSIQKIEPRLLHAAPPQLSITKEFCNYQHHGDIIYFALEALFSTIPPGSNRLQWCEEYLNVQYFAHSMQNQMNKIHAILKHVDHINSIMHRANLVTLLPPRRILLIEQSIKYMKDYLLYARNYLESQKPENFFNDFMAYFECIPSWSELLDAVKQKLRQSTRIDGCEV